MDLKPSKLLVVLMIACCHPCNAEGVPDQKLLEIAHSAFDQSRAARNKNLGIQAIRDGMADLNDAEKTRAMALLIFDLDAKDHGRMRDNPASLVEIALMEDPALIGDPAELKRMIAKEDGGRKFYILAAIAVQLMNSQKADFVAEMSPMLFRHGPVTKTSVDSEYYNEGLTDASFLAYGLIAKNLEILNTKFVPPDQSLPYTERIPILVKWLRENWPGCENLGIGKTASIETPSGLGNVEETAGRKGEQIPANDHSPKHVPLPGHLWPILATIVILVLALGVWFRFR